jgi:CBS-domain-containing membrane protein
MVHSVRDVMTREVVTVTASTPFKQVVRLLHGHRISAVPVVDPDGCLLGIVSETDLALKEEEQQQQQQPSGWAPRRERARKRRDRARAAGTLAAHCMSTPVATVEPTASVGAAARLLHRRGVSQLPVVDRDGRLVGIVTRRDLLAVFLRRDEEIHHEILSAVLDATLNLPFDAVRVRVEEGEVTLTGHVPWPASAREVVQLVAGVDGVVAVRSHLTEDPKVGAQPATPSWK